jgi:hypothetical protein
MLDQNWIMQAHAECLIRDILTQLWVLVLADVGIEAVGPVFHCRRLISAEKC